MRIEEAGQGKWTTETKEPTAELKMGKIQEEMNGLDQATDRLISLVSNLNDRLTPILRPPIPKTNDDEKETEYGIIYADSIKSQKIRVMVIESQLCDIIGRIEL